MLHTFTRTSARASKAALLLVVLGSLASRSEAGFLVYGSDLQVTTPSNAVATPSNDSPTQVVNVVTNGGTTIQLDTSNYQIRSDLTDRVHITPSGTDITFGDIYVHTTETTPAENNIQFGFNFTIQLRNFSTPVGGVSDGVFNISVSGMIQSNLGPGRSSMMRTMSYAFDPSDAIIPISPNETYEITSFNFVPPGARGDAGRFSITIRSLNPVPEPGSLVLMGLGGGLGVLGLVRKARRARGFEAA